MVLENRSSKPYIIQVGMQAVQISNFLGNIGSCTEVTGHIEFLCSSSSLMIRAKPHV